MTWTATTPAFTGYYWHRADAVQVPCVVLVWCPVGGSLTVRFNDADFPPSEFGGQWAGPIQPPA